MYKPITVSRQIHETRLMTLYINFIYQLASSVQVLTSHHFRKLKKNLHYWLPPCEWKVILIDISCFRLKIAGATCTYVSDFNIGGVTMLSKNFFCKDQNAHEKFQATSSLGLHSWTDSHDLMSFVYVSFWDLKVGGETFSYIEY